jgi:gamma-glutamylcyclotransferase (GGCT)/AIG2-like uncharacterized protein YtfP
MEQDPFIGHRVFVYGTLRRGFVNNDATLAFRAASKFLCMGQVPGALYGVGWYPALIEAGEGHVTGEVWELIQPGTMDILDEYEGLFDEGPPEYRREIRAVRTEQGPLDAWVYIYAHDVNPLNLIPSGDWANAFNDA